MKTWNIGTKIWFGFYIFTQWAAFIDTVTARWHPTNLLIQYALTGFVMSLLILWLAVTHMRLARNVLLILAAVNAVYTLFTIGFVPMLFSLILPGINYLVTRNGLE